MSKLVWCGFLPYFFSFAISPFLKGLASKPTYKAELLQLNPTQFPSLGIFVSKKVGNQKN